MKKLLYTILFITASEAFAGEFPATSSQSQQQIVCVKCKEQREELFPFCKECKAKICTSCDIELTMSSEFVLDKSGDHFFYKSDCFNCKKKIRVYGAVYTSKMRQWMLVERGLEEPYESIYSHEEHQQSKKELEKTVILNQDPKPNNGSGCLLQ